MQKNRIEKIRLCEFTEGREVDAVGVCGECGKAFASDHGGQVVIDVQHGEGAGGGKTILRCKDHMPKPGGGIAALVEAVEAHLKQ